MLRDKLINTLQRVQNSAARLVTGAKKRDHISQILSDLHWLPIKKRIMFKLLLIVYKSLNHAAPKYLSELLRPYHPKPNLRSSTRSLLVVPNSRLKSFGDKAFEIAGPKLWNALPMNIRAASTTHQFKSLLKTYLFTLDVWTFHNVIVLLNCFYHFLAYCRLFQKSCGLVCNFYGFLISCVRPTTAFIFPFVWVRCAIPYPYGFCMYAYLCILIVYYIIFVV